MIVDCDYCGEPFKQRRTSQRYCCKQHRVNAAVGRFRCKNPLPLKDIEAITKRLPYIPLGEAITRPREASTGLKPYVWPDDRKNPLHGLKLDGSTPGALQGDDYPLEYDADGYPILPACLDRRWSPQSGKELPQSGDTKDLSVAA
jgi:hypothetical protein